VVDWIKQSKEGTTGGTCENGIKASDSIKDVNSYG